MVDRLDDEPLQDRRFQFDGRERSPARTAALSGGSPSPGRRRSRWLGRCPGVYSVLESASSAMSAGGPAAALGVCHAASVAFWSDVGASRESAAGAGRGLGHQKDEGHPLLDHRSSRPDRAPRTPADVATQRRASVGSATDRGPAHLGSPGRRTVWLIGPCRRLAIDRLAGVDLERPARISAISRLNRCESRLWDPVARSSTAEDASRLHQAAPGGLSSD